MKKKMRSCLLISYKLLSPTPSKLVDVVGDRIMKDHCWLQSIIQKQGDLIIQPTERRIWIKTRLLWSDSGITFYVTNSRSILGKEAWIIIVSLEHVWQEQKGALDAIGPNSSRCIRQWWNPVSRGHVSMVPSHKEIVRFLSERQYLWLLA